MKRFFAKYGVWLMIASLVCLMMAAWFCSRNPAIFANTTYYTIYTGDQEWHMRFYPQRWGGQKVEYKYLDRARTVPLFSSLSEMRRALKHGLIDPFYLSSIHEEDKSDVCTIYNLDRLQELIAPKGMEYSFIAFGGDGYNFHFRDQAIQGHVDVCSPRWYEWYMKTYYTGFASDREILSDTTVEDRNARVIESIFESYQRKDILYTIQLDELTLYIREEYLTQCLVDTPYTVFQSETIPHNVYIFGNDGANTFYGQFSGFEDRPSVQWLTSFALKPHDETISAWVGLSVGTVLAGAILAAAGYREKRRNRNG